MKHYPPKLDAPTPGGQAETERKPRKRKKTRRGSGKRPAKANGIERSDASKSENESGFFITLRGSGASGYYKSARQGKKQIQEKENEQRARGGIKGWSDKSSRNYRRFYQSTDIEGLESGEHGYGYALTLTLDKCPPCHKFFHGIRKQFLEKLRKKLGMTHFIWVLECSEVKPNLYLPHLHLAIWLPKNYLHRSIIREWVKCALTYAPDPIDQHVTEIYDLPGWLEYMAKAADNKQRQAACMPSHWTETGQVWNHSRNFPTLPEENSRISRKTFYAVRRTVTKIHISRKRKALENENSKKPYSDKLSELKKVRDYLKVEVKKRDNKTEEEIIEEKQSRSSVLPFNLGNSKKHREKIRRLVFYFETL